MRKNSIKNIRINGEVQKELSQVIRNEVKDPRVHPMTSVVSVDVTADLKLCRVYISVLADDEKANATLEGLNKAKPYIRKRLAQTVNLRNTPEINFILDQSIEYGVNMSARIDEIAAADRRAQERRHELGLDMEEEN